MEVLIVIGVAVFATVAFMREAFREMGLDDVDDLDALRRRYPHHPAFYEGDDHADL